jgi:lauroyl/myristoyl acyltransferase
VSAIRDLRDAWAGRPPAYNRFVWALVLVLGRLPWPWGEEMFAAGFALRVFLKTARLRQALAWAATQTGPGRKRWRLARALCAYHGRFVARSALVGVRDVESLRRLVSVRGEAHLAALPGAAILLGCHLGPAGSYLALRVAGQRLTWVGGRGASGAWSREIRTRYQSAAESQFFSRDALAWTRRLYQARRMLVDGERVFISADGEGGSAFAVPLPGGGSIAVGTGWLALRRATGALVLPVLSHMEGRVQVVTVHPPLPQCDADPQRDLDLCRSALGRVFGEHVLRFPEQCYSLAFPVPLAGSAPAISPSKMERKASTSTG